MGLVANLSEIFFYSSEKTASSLAAASIAFCFLLFHVSWIVVHFLM